LSRPTELGIDRRVIVGLVALTTAMSGVGFVIAAGIDRSGRRTAAEAAPTPSLSPEAIDPDVGALTTGAAAQALPPVIIGTLARATDAPAAPLPSAPAPAPTADGPAVVVPSRTTTPTTPAASATAAPPGPRPTTKPPAATPSAPKLPQGAPAADPGDPVPFRPDSATQPLPQFLVPDGALSVDTAATTATLRAAQKTAPAGATRADIAYVLSLGQQFANARLAGRKATVARTLGVNAWWYAQRSAPAGRVLVRDPDGLIYSYQSGHGFALNPVGTAGRWQGLNEGFSNTQLATTLLTVGVAEIRGGRQTLNWEYYDIPDQPAAIKPGVSAMAQSRVGQVMANAFRATGDPQFATAAVDAMASLAVDVGAGGTRSLVAYPAGSAAAPWFVERAYPGQDPWKGAALNGFMVSIIELRSAEQALRNGATGASAAGEAAANEARRLADEGAATLDRYLPAHDTGEWSYYGLLTPGRPFRSYLANATYHCYHVTLLRTLAPQYPTMTFGAFADTWAGYATKAGTPCPTSTPTG
jgi:D-glucuronyl C5-epimerase C-terminus